MNPVTLNSMLEPVTDKLMHRSAGHCMKLPSSSVSKIIWGSAEMRLSNRINPEVLSLISRLVFTVARSLEMLKSVVSPNSIAVLFTFRSSILPN